MQDCFNGCIHTLIGTEKTNKKYFCFLILKCNIENLIKFSVCTQSRDIINKLIALLYFTKNVA